MKLILASASPRRIEMFKNNGFDPEVIPSDFNEHIPFKMTPAETVMYLSLMKGLSVQRIFNDKQPRQKCLQKDTSTGSNMSQKDPVPKLSRNQNNTDQNCKNQNNTNQYCKNQNNTRQNCKNQNNTRQNCTNQNYKNVSQGIYQSSYDVIVSADTIVVDNNTILGKPIDENDAFSMLSSLSGRSHHVLTGVTIITGNCTRCFFETSEVFFKDIPENELRAYVATPEPYDKAGGYAIQETFSKYVQSYTGDIDNIIGFPFSRFLKEYQSI